MSGLHSEAVRSTWSTRYVQGRERVLGRQVRVPVNVDAERQADVLAENLSTVQLEALADALVAKAHEIRRRAS